MEVMLRGVAEPGSWQASATAALSTAKGPAVHIGSVADAVEAAGVMQGEGEREGEGEGEGEKAPRLSRKEQILARARLHAKMPAPDVTGEEEVVVVERTAKRRVEKKPKQQQQQQQEMKEAEVSTLRERLMQLVGGKWF